MGSTMKTEFRKEIKNAKTEAFILPSRDTIIHEETSDRVTMKGIMQLEIKGIRWW